jgi:Rieske 2Fe-2S family protein
MPDDFDWNAHGLNKVSCDVIHGLVFISFSNQPPSLENCKAELAEPMAMFDFEKLKVAAYKEYVIPANWKLSIENYQECYHCATAHPDYARMHTLMLDRKKRERVQSHMKERMEACGLKEIYIDRIDTAARPGEIGYGYSRTALFDGYRTGSRDGEPVAPLLGKLTDYDGGASDFSFGGFSFLLAYSDHVVGYVFTPIDKDSSRCDIYWLVRGDAEEGKDYDVDELTWLWDITTEADKSIIVNNSKGVHSRFYRPGPFSGMEKAEMAYVEWLLKQLSRPTARLCLEWGQTAFPGKMRSDPFPVGAAVGREWFARSSIDVLFAAGSRSNGTATPFVPRGGSQARRRGRRRSRTG